MEDSKYTLEYIDQYLSGQLSEEDVLAFEKQIEQDQILQNSVKEVIRTKATSYLAGRTKWVEEMNQKFDTHLGPRRFNFWPLLIAAVVAVFLVLSGLWWSRQNSVLSPGEIYAQVYTVPQAPEYRGDADSLLSQAYSRFNSGEFEQALSSFEIVLSRDDFTKREEVFFFKGIALVEMGKESEALKAFSAVRDEQYGESARFYQALTLIKREEIDPARKILVKLVEFDGTLKRKAEQILEMLGEGR